MAAYKCSCGAGFKSKFQADYHSRTQNKKSEVPHIIRKT